MSFIPTKQKNFPTDKIYFLNSLYVFDDYDSVDITRTDQKPALFILCTLLLGRQGTKLSNLFDTIQPNMSCLSLQELKKREKNIYIPNLPDLTTTQSTRSQIFYQVNEKIPVEHDVMMMV